MSAETDATSASDDIKAGIAECLRRLIGRGLLGVTYRCLEGESSAEEVASESLFFLGGEVELRFERTEPIFLSWQEVRREDAWYCLGARSESFFLPERLVPFDAASAPPWRGISGEPLVGCSVLGADGIPFAVALSFRPRTVVIATGRQSKAIGDADDVLVVTGEDLPRLRRSHLLETLWREGEP